jgi:hypothetical protein
VTPTGRPLIANCADNCATVPFGGFERFPQLKLKDTPTTVASAGILNVVPDANSVAEVWFADRFSTKEPVPHT